jgi:O-antigen/teichoic acid export membrane protein
LFISRSRQPRCTGFSQYHSAGDRHRLSEFLAQAIRWTFWPSAVVTALLLVAGQHCSICLASNLPAAII